MVECVGCVDSVRAAITKSYLRSYVPCSVQDNVSDDARPLRRLTTSYTNNTLPRNIL